MPTAEVLRIERTYAAPAAAVFDAWTSEEVLRRWFHSERDWTTSEASVDLRVGGAVRVVIDDPDDPTPYWVISTRHPTRLAQAIIGARA